MLQNKRFYAVIVIILALFTLAGCLPISGVSDYIRDVLDNARGKSDAAHESPRAEITPAPDPSEAPPPEEQPGRRTVPFDEMEYERPDIDALEREFLDMAARVKNAGSAQEILDIDGEMETLSNSFSTMFTLANIRTSMDVNDEYWAGEFGFLSQSVPNLQTAQNVYYAAVGESGFRGELEDALGAAFFDNIDVVLKLMNEEAEPLYEKESALIKQYQEVFTTGTVDVNGQKLTINEISPDSGLSYDEYVKALNTWYEVYNEKTGAIFVELVKTRQEMARVLGFNSYIDMAYMRSGFDYTPEDTAALENDIKKYAVPVYNRLLRDSRYIDPLLETPYDDAMYFIGETLSALDPSFYESFAFMHDYALYDYDKRPGKMNGAFSTYIRDYDAPFMLASWGDDNRSLFTIVHEFGHFNDYYYFSDLTVYETTDTAEIFSQALELLVSNHIGDIYGDRGDEVMAYVALGLFEAYAQQAYFDEFQREVYALGPESVNLKNINGLALELSKDYGLYIPGYRWLSEYGWITIPHIFESPFYTFSYVTSADVAFQVWEQSLDDERRAVDTYLELLKREQSDNFIENVEAAGLISPFDKGRAKYLSELMSDFINEEKAA